MLAEYCEGFLDQMIAVVTASTVTAYALYTMSPETVGNFHTRLVPITLPFVLYGIFRYLYLIYDRKDTRSTDALLLEDYGMIGAGVVWVASAVILLAAYN